MISFSLYDKVWWLINLATDSQIVKLTILSNP